MESRLTPVTLVSFLVIAGGCTSTSASGALDAVAMNPDGASDGSGEDRGQALAPPECVLVLASGIDKSCRSDSDCIGVGEGEVCDPCTLVCHVEAINVDASTRYLAAFANTPAAVAVTSQPGPPCGCFEVGAPCCRGGMCQFGTICTMPASDAAADMSPDVGAAAEAGGPGAADAGQDAVPE